MSRSGRDPRKGVEKGMKAAQDKVLDLLGPIAKILYFADLALSQGSQLDPHIIREWSQRSVCLLGNANATLCTERRKSALIRIDSKLLDLGAKEFGPKAQGQLFGDAFIAELKKHVNLFTTLNKAQTSLKQVFHTPTTRGVFGRAGRQRNRATSRFWTSGSRSFPQAQSFFPSTTQRSSSFRGTGGSRGFRGQIRGRFSNV
ncbi:uncharacterized protein LOC134570871 [Pelobates fuscus]|uniref:uncharacterized protein LOC134570871 n=1 Tax=Pelobates fuscus TaxID=191477 RepID=UPI002FE4BEE1